MNKSSKKKKICQRPGQCYILVSGVHFQCFLLLSSTSLKHHSCKTRSLKVGIFDPDPRTLDRAEFIQRRVQSLRFDVCCVSVHAPRG